MALAVLHRDLVCSLGVVSVDGLLHLQGALLLLIGVRHFLGSFSAGCYGHVSCPFHSPGIARYRCVFFLYRVCSLCEVRPGLLGILAELDIERFRSLVRSVRIEVMALAVLHRDLVCSLGVVSVDGLLDLKRACLYLIC